ncbi:40S ribosomal protein S17, variant 3 [Lathyrus oleraceus]|uniref:40S ribosomal protein S17, variant 3 n=1 Tax=Pisum sativum TaxID=3888 RepID=A0A9D4YMC2_PEA|nr:40S ribosomal protein S17, variant 3 [Pisum sativum]
MGRVRTKTVKKSSRQVIERYYSRMTLDFHTNKKILEEVALIPTKRLRNKIAGFSTHLMKRIQKGPVRGISLKLQEEERERRMDFVPEVSAIRTDQIEVDKETLEMLAALGMSEIPGVVQVDPVAVQPIPFGRGGGGAGAPGRRGIEEMLTGPTGLHHQDQKIFYKNKERVSKEFLDVVGVKDKSKLVLMEDPISKEKRYLEMRKNVTMEKASKSISEISLDVDRLAGQVATFNLI